MFELITECLAIVTSTVDAVTLTGGGTDITPASASDIASTALAIIVNYLAPIGGAGMLAASGASFARNRQSGIGAGPASLGVGGAVMILSPSLAGQLLASSSQSAVSLAMQAPELSMSINPILVASFVAIRWIRARYAA